MAALLFAHSFVVHINRRSSVFLNEVISATHFWQLIESFTYLTNLLASYQHHPGSSLYKEPKGPCPNEICFLKNSTEYSTSEWFPVSHSHDPVRWPSFHYFFSKPTDVFYLQCLYCSYSCCVLHFNFFCGNSTVYNQLKFIYVISK